VTAWTPDELARMGRAEEIDVASRRSDGTLRQFVTVWFVRVGDDLYVRSAHGPTNGWFQRALASGQGRVRVAGVERDVAFVVPSSGAGAQGELDRAYHAKYDR